MPRLTRESQVMIGNKNITVEEILKTIIYLPQEKIKNYFEELGLTIPRELRIHALKENLREKVAETRKSRLTMADELNYRLSWFTEFSETQLENLLVFFDDEEIFKNFLEDFWTSVLGYMVDKQVSAQHLKDLHALSVAHVKQNGLTLPNMKTYNRYLKDLFFDRYGRIDGLVVKNLRPVLYKSSTLSEIRDLGTKYGVNVPRRLKKSELAEIIITELKDTGKYTEELAAKVNGMSVIVLQRFAIDNDIKASTELKKEEIIEYILKNAKETKEIYFVPESIEEYEKEIHDISEEPVVEEEPIVSKEEVVVQTEPEEIVLDEIVVEEEIKEVEVRIEEEPQVHYQASTVNLDGLTEEIKKLREAVEKSNVIRESRIEEVRFDQQDAVEEHEDDLLDTEQQELLVLNSAEFLGDQKQYKKLLKTEQANERAKFIEARKEEMLVSEEDDKLPIEARFLKKLGKILLKLVLTLAVIAIVFLILYGLLTYYVTTLDFLDGFNTKLNGLLSIRGRGLLEFVHHLFSSIGM